MKTAGSSPAVFLGEGSLGFHPPRALAPAAVDPDPLAPRLVVPARRGRSSSAPGSRTLGIGCRGSRSASRRPARPRLGEGRPAPRLAGSTLRSGPEPTLAPAGPRPGSDRRRPVGTRPAACTAPRGSKRSRARSGPPAGRRRRSPRWFGRGRCGTRRSRIRRRGRSTHRRCRGGTWDGLRFGWGFFGWDCLVGNFFRWDPARRVSRTHLSFGPESWGRLETNRVPPAAGARRAASGAPKALRHLGLRLRGHRLLSRPVDTSPSPRRPPRRRFVGVPEMKWDSPPRANPNFPRRRAGTRRAATSRRGAASACRGRACR